MKLRYNLEQRRWLRYLMACRARGERAYWEFYRPSALVRTRRRGPLRSPRR